MVSRASTVLVFALAALAGIGAALLTPSVVDARTRYVDDDGRAGRPHGCDGPRRVPTAIQDAVDAADRGDLVLVCPGRYVGWVRFRPGDEGVTLAGAERWEATLIPPSASVDGWPQGVVMINRVSDVRVEGLRFVPCRIRDPRLEAIVLRNSSSSVIRENRVVSHGPVAAEGRCSGIKALLSDGVRMVRNVVIDFGLTGITLWGSSGEAVGNRLRCGGPRRRLVSCGAGLHAEDGCCVRFDTRARIVGNRILGPPLAADGSVRGILDTGIQTSVMEAIVGGNRIIRSMQGIVAEGGTFRVVENDIVKGRKGIQVAFGRGSEIAENVVTDNRGRGILVVVDGSGVTIRDNDFRGNRGVDCEDWTSGSGTAGTATMWERNLGDESRPSGLCLPDGG